MFSPRSLVLVSVLLAPAAASAQPVLKDGPPPEHRLVYTSLAALRLNATGLVEIARVSYRRRLYLAEPLPLRENYLGAGLSTLLSPAYARVGALVEAQPLTPLRLWAQFEIASYFGGFGILQSYPSAAADFSDGAARTLSELPEGDARRNYPSAGWHATLGADVQLKLGPVALRNFTKLQTARLSLRGGDVAFYDQTEDVLAPNGGVVIVNDADLLFVTDGGLVAGARFNVTQPFYASDAPHGNLAARVGPLVAYTFFSEDGAMFNNPTVLVVAGWWLAHRWRTGAETSQLMPYLVFGFAFTGDLLPLRR